MKLELAQKIIEICNDYGYNDYDELELREDYNFGGMMRTAAITGLTLGELARIVIENANHFVDDKGDPLFDDIGSLRQDSMGRGTIIY